MNDSLKVQCSETLFRTGTTWEVDIQQPLHISVQFEITHETYRFLFKEINKLITNIPNPESRGGGGVVALKKDCIRYECVQCHTLLASATFKYKSDTATS